MKAKTVKPKAEQPETLAQARKWDEVKSRYLAAGLCHVCAAQAAWGHQLGFGYQSPRPWPPQDRGIKPPCEKCAPIVAEFPVPAVGGMWRKLLSASDERRRLARQEASAERI